MGKFPFPFFFLVEFKKYFLIRILNIWFHKGRISLWHATVSKWSKSGQTEADWQWNTVEREESVMPKAGEDSELAN